MQITNFYVGLLSRTVTINFGGKHSSNRQCSLHIIYTTTTIITLLTCIKVDTLLLLHLYYPTTSFGSCHFWITNKEKKR